MIQQMKAHGVQSEVVSVDRSMDAYDALKSALYERRIEFYRYDPFVTELRTLEYDKVRGKVDHPVAGTKDVADAVAGMVYALVKGARLSNVVMPDLDLETKESDSWVSNKIMVPQGSMQSIAQDLSGMPLPFIMG
jgi:basic membrane lipoprotein Med (substrate-binding protein (PBP1-ABC) superfamily)